MTEHRIIDLFAGAGGWDEAAAELGVPALGIEIDPRACETAEAAGHARVRADIASLDPADYRPPWGVIASPPCQAYSIAGRKLGRLDEPQVIACAHELAAGMDRRAVRRTRCRDERSLLAVEPLRWIVALKPRWVAMEQVPPARALWELLAELLEDHGYATTSGIISAEQFGVPQSRRRAFLIASLDGPVALPEPTHRSFSPRRPDQVKVGEEHLLPWVSMAQALGWQTPRVTQTNCQTDSGRRPRGLVRPANRPARTIDSTAGVWTFGSGTPGVANASKRADRPRSIGCPTHTPVSPSLARTSRPAWAFCRPATTVMGDPRVHKPGAKRSRHCPNGHDRAGRDAVRLTPEQAGVLQGFRRDYPWQGARTRQFLQVGNAVCPPVARAVLRAAMAPSIEAQRARSSR